MTFFLCGPGGDLEPLRRDGRNISLPQGATLSPVEEDKM